MRAALLILLRRALAAVRAWWVARREYRRSLCTWCSQPLWHSDQPPVRTEYLRRPVHLDCKWPADDDELEGATW